MSQKFLMLFLTSQDGLVSINFAARVLLGDTKNDTTELGRFKTKIRRLYDIASVLTSIGLIKKYHFTDVNISKPAYMYIGPNVDIIREAENVVDFQNSGNPKSNSKHSLFDHFKRKLNMECNIPTFDVNTGILASKKAKTESSNLSLSQRQSTISLEKTDNEQTIAKAQGENGNIMIVKQERVDIDERLQSNQHNTQIDPVYQPLYSLNNDNRQYYSNHEEYTQQYYAYSQADQCYASNSAYNSNANNYANENNLYNSNDQLCYQRYYNQNPQYNAQLQTSYYNTGYNENEHQKLNYSCDHNFNQESKAPLVIDEPPSTWTCTREVNFVEQEDKNLISTSISTLSSISSSSENLLPSFNTFLN